MTRSVPASAAAGLTFVWFPEIAPAGDWIDQAACRGHDPALWFPSRGGSSAAAAEICAACPVRTECLDYAVVNRIHEGIWGGLGDARRRPLTRRTPRPVRPSPLHGSAGRYRMGCHCVDCREAHKVEAARYRDHGATP